MRWLLRFWHDLTNRHLKPAPHFYSRCPCGLWVGGQIVPYVGEMRRPY